MNIISIDPERVHAHLERGQMKTEGRECGCSTDVKPVPHVQERVRFKMSYPLWDKKRAMSSGISRGVAKMFLPLFA